MQHDKDFKWIRLLSQYVLFSTVGFESLLEASRYSDLCLLYQLFLRFKNGLELICKAFAGYIKVLGVNTCGGQRLLNECVILLAHSNNIHLYLLQ